MGDREIIEVVETKGVPETLSNSGRMTSRSLKVGFSSEEKSEGEAQWVRQQRKAFMRWCNAFLIQRNLVLSDLEEDLSSGVLLCNLLELLAGKKLPTFAKAPKMKVQKVLNSQVALDWITKTEKLKLVGIGPEDIYDKKTKLILGLIWTLILRFQIQVGKWTVAGKKTTAKAEMLEWCNAALSDYHVEVSDFSSGWKDGRAFTGLTNYLLKQKGATPIELRAGAPTEEIIDQAFLVAAKEFNIPKLLDADDMADPDELSVMTYVSYFRQNDKLSPEELLAQREAGAVGSAPSASAATPAKTTTTTVRAIKTIGAEGEGLARAVCGDVTYFSCVTKDDKGEVHYSADTVFYGTLELPPHKKVASFEDKKSGVYIGSYTLEVAGTYELIILYNDKPISSKPFRVVAEPGAVWPPFCYADGKGLNFTRSGDSSHFRVLTFDKHSNALTKGGNKIAVKFEGPENITGNVKDETNGTYQVEYVITKSGTFKIFVTCNGEPIKGSPFELQVEAGEPSAQFVVAEGEGLHRVIAGEIAKFFVHVRDKHGNPSVKHAEGRSLTARLAGPSELDCNVEDQANGSYTVTYEATVSGQHKLFVHYNDQDTVGSPFDVTVLPGPVHAGKSSAEGEGLTEVVCGAEGKFVIVTRDAYKNRITTASADAPIEVSLVQEGQKPINGSVKSNEDGTYTVHYTLSIAGYYKLLITIGGKPLQGSPYQVLARPGPLDAASTTLEGQLAGLPAGEIVYLIIRPRDRFGNLTTAFDVAEVQAALAGAEKLDATIKHNLSEGTLTLSAKPTQPGEYKLNVAFGGKAIRGSPYTLSVLAGKVSAAHSIAEGEGLHSAVSGRKTTFKLITKDEKGAVVNLGGAAVGGYLEGVEKVTFSEVVDHADGTYTVHYIPRAAGKTNLNVTIDGYSIEGSPFAVSVKPGSASAKASVAYGAGIAEAVAGEAAQYSVEIRDEHANLVHTDDDSLKVTAELTGPAKVASTVANNKDGTFSGDYKTDVAGAYQLALKLNGENIGESPYHVQVVPGAISVGHTEVEGKGLAEAVVGEKATFRVVPKDAHGNIVLHGGVVAALGGAPADAVVVTKGPAGYEVEYTVAKSGPYKLNVSAGGSPVKGSPFNVSVHAGQANADNFLVEGKGLASSVVGDKTAFTVRAKDRFGNDVTTGGAKVEAELIRVVFKDPTSGASPSAKRKGGDLGAGAGGLLGLARKEIETEGTPVHATVKDNGDGTYTGEYVLSAAGDYALNVKANGTLIKGSPFSVTAEAGEVDLNNTVLKGEALARKLVAGDDIQLVLVPQDKLGNPVSLDAEHPVSVNVDGPEPSAFTLKPNTEGAIQLAGKLNKPGKYNITVTIAGKPIKGSPYEVHVEAGKISAKNTFAEGEGLTSAVAGAPAHITVRSLDDKGNAINTGGAAITAGLVGPEELSAAVADNKDGTYTVTYNPKLAGNYVLAIKSEGLPIKNSPFSLSVNPGESNAASSVAFGQGLVEGPAGKQAKFTVQAKDTFGNNLKAGGHKVTAHLAGPEEVAVEVADNKDGSYVGQYTARQAGAYTLQVSLDGKPVKESPFSVEITAGIADSTHTTAEGKGLTQTTANETSYFVVATKDALGNLVKVGGANVTAVLKSAAGASDPIAITDNHDGTYTADFTVGVAGDYNVEIALNGTPIKDSPFKLQVEAGAASTSNTTAEGEGLVSATSGHEASFVVVTKDSNGNLVGKGGNTVTASLKGPETTEGTVHDKGDGTYEVRYTPALAGNYSLRVKVDKQHIKDSPFKVSVAPGALSAAKSVVIGDSVSKATAGIAEKFLIHAKDAAGNNIKAGGADFSASLEGETKVSLPIVDNGDGTYSVEYTPSKSGQQLLHVLVGGVPIKDSPFNVSVASGAISPAHCTLEGEGLADAIAGEPEHFTLVLKDKFGNRLRSGAAVALNAKVEDATESEIYDNNDGTFRVQYRINKTGPKTVHMFVDGQPVAGLPFTVAVKPAVASPVHTYAFGEGLKTAKAGQDANYKVQVADVFDNNLHTGGHNITAALEGPSKVAGKVTDNKDGTYTVEYNTKEAGTYKIRTAFESGGEIKNSPHTVEVLAGEAKAENFAFDEVTPSPAGVAGEAVKITLSARDAFGNKSQQVPADIGAVQGSIQLDADAEEVLAIREQGPGIYVADYLPSKTGVYVINARVGDVATKGSPFRYEVKPGDVSAHGSKVETPDHITAGEPTVFVVRAKDKFGNAVFNPVDVIAFLIDDKGNKYPATLTSPERGAYHLEFKPTTSGNFRFEGTINGQPLEGVPTSFTATASRALPDHTTVTLGEGLNTAVTPATAKAGKPAHFSVKFGDQFGNVAKPADGAIKAVLRPASAAGGRPRSSSLTRQGSVPRSLQAAAQQAGNRSQANLTPLKVAEVAPVDVAALRPNEDGSFSGEVVPKVVGRYFLDLTLDGQPVKDSPFEISVEAGAISPAHALLEGAGLLGAPAGEPIRLTLVLRDEQGNKIIDPAAAHGVKVYASVEPESGDGEKVTPEVTANPDGTFTLEYKVNGTGRYKLLVRVNDTPIEGAPFSVAIAAGSVNPASSTAAGEGLHSANAGEEGVFEVVAKDKGGNRLLSGGNSVTSFLQGPEKVDVHIHDNGDGSYAAKYSVKTVGDYKLHVVVEGKPISQSPFAVTVKSGKPNADASDVKGNFDFRCGKTETFVIHLRDGAGNPAKSGGANIRATFLPDLQGAAAGAVGAGAAAEPIDVAVVDNGDGTYTVTVPGAKVSGKYVYALSLDNSNFRGSPFHVEVQPGAARRVTFSSAELDGEGNVNAVAGNSYTLQLQASDEFGNVIRKGGRDVEFRLEGPSKLALKVNDNDDGTYAVAYKLNVAGRYQAHISVDGHSLPSVLQFDIKANEISPTHTIAIGNGIKKAKAGEEASFLVQSLDRFGNEIQIGGAEIIAYLRGPEGADVEAQQHNVAIADNGEGIYHATYTVEVAGRYQLFVTANGQAISQSPFAVRVASGFAVAGKSVVKQGTELPAGKARAGLPAFKIHLRDRNGNFKSKGGDEIHAYLKKPTRKPARIIDNKDGTYDVIYPKGLELGEYEVVAELKGERIEIPTPTVQVEEPSPLPEEEQTLVSNLFPSSSSVIANLLRNLDDAQKATLLADLATLKK